MSLLGTAALAMWWDIAPDVRADFEDWHAHEHFPERLSVPGFLRGTRWRSASGGDGMFVMYEMADHAVLSSPAYVARLNAPTPWSMRLMPHHRNMVRSQCQVLASSGGGVARHALTLRLSPAAGAAAALESFFRTLTESAARRPGLTGAHLLRHQTPDMPATTEQRIRNGADGVADWVFVACGYEREALAALQAGELAPRCLEQQGAAGDAVSEVYAMAVSATFRDVL